MPALTEHQAVRLATIAATLFVIADEIAEKVLDEVEQLRVVVGHLHKFLVWEWMAAAERQLTECAELTTTAAERLHDQVQGDAPRPLTVAAAIANLRELHTLQLRDLEQRMAQVNEVLKSPALADVIGRLAELRRVALALEGRVAAQEEELAAVLAPAPVSAPSGGA